MKRFLYKVLQYTIMVAIVGNGIAFVANFFLKKSSFYKPGHLVRHFDPAEKFDYFLAGSSRGLTTVDTDVLDTILGTRGINLSLDDTGLPSHFLMIRHFFETGFKANNCILVVDEAHFNSSPTLLNDNDYRFGPFAAKPYIKEYFAEREPGIIKKLAYSSYFPVLAYSYYNTELFFPSLIASVKPELRHLFNENGNYSYPDASPYPKGELKKKPVIKQMTIDNPLLRDLEQYLAAHGCQLILYIAPYRLENIEVSDHLRIPLINHSAKIPDQSMFFDDLHVTKSGNQLATFHLAEGVAPLLKKN